MIFPELNTLAEVMDDGDRARRKSWLLNIALMIAADFCLVYCQILGLDQQRAGQPYLREAMMFLLAVNIWCLSAKSLWNRTGTALTAGTRALSDRIIERLSCLSLDRYESLGRAQVMLRLTADAPCIAQAARPLIGVPTALLRLSLGALIAFLVHPLAAVVAAGVLVLMGFAITTQLRVMRQGSARTAEDEAGIYDLLRGQVAGATQLELHAPRANAIEQFFAVISERIRTSRVSIFAEFFKRRHAANAALYGILGVNAFLLPLVIPVEVTIIREINLVLVWVVFSLFGIVFALPDLSSASEALHRLRNFEESLAEEKVECDADDATTDRLRGFETLSVRGLRYSYPKNLERGEFAVGPIDLSLRRGEVVFITGRNGSGKSTFLKMLTGLYSCEAGDVLVDDAVVDQDEIASYRELFGAVFTDHHIFSRTFGMSDDAEKQVETLLQEMQIDHVTGIRDGRIAKRDLSTGEKKRLAMVLTRLQDRPILVFDEWAADQDPKFRELYYREILPALKTSGPAGKLVLVVTHDDQYFDCADRIIRFENGGIDE